MTMQDAAAARRKSVTVGVVMVLHAVMFYGFTHGMKLKPPQANNDVTLVDVDPLPPPKPNVPALPFARAVVDFQIPDQAPVIDVNSMTDVTPTYEEMGTPSTAERATDEHGSSPQVETRNQSVTVLRRVEPAYPAAARRAGEQGTVLVSVMVDANGHVSAATVMQSSGSMVLDDAAVEAVRRWQFSAHGAGTVQVRVPISFRLQVVRF